MASSIKSGIKRFILGWNGPAIRLLMRARRLRSYPNEIDECIDVFSSEPLSVVERKLLKKAIKKDMYEHLITPDEYFLYDFAEKNEKEKDEFVGDMERTILCSRMYNSNPAGLIFMDKMATYKCFAEFFKRDVIEIAKQEDFEVFSAFADKHHEYMVKPSEASRGEGVRKETAPTNYKEKQKAFACILKSGKSVLEEVIDQSDEMAALHPESVNTIRFATFVDHGKKVILASFVKIGRGSSVVDNGGMGGFLAAVDEHTGIITTPGRTERAEVIDIHPDTGVAIEGYQIPAWSELLSLVDQLVQVLPEQKYVGWDLAHSATKGWLLVEGNSGGQFVGPQISMRKGVRPLISKTFGSV